MADKGLGERRDLLVSELLAVSLMITDLCCCDNGSSENAWRSEARSQEFVFARHVVGIITHDTALTLALCWLPTVAPKHSAATLYHKNRLQAGRRKSVQLCDATKERRVAEYVVTSLPHNSRGSGQTDVLTDKPLEGN